MMTSGHASEMEGTFHASEMQVTGVSLQNKKLTCVCLALNCKRMETNQSWNCALRGAPEDSDRFASIEEDARH